jgi:hypothetical protein
MPRVWIGPKTGTDSMSVKIAQYVTGNTFAPALPLRWRAAARFAFSTQTCVKIQSLVSYYYPFRRKEGTMMTFPIPGDPQGRSPFLPEVSRS